MSAEADVDLWLNDGHNPGRVRLWTPVKAAFFQSTRGKYLTLMEWVGLSASAAFIALPTVTLAFSNRLSWSAAAAVILSMWLIKVVQTFGARSAVFKKPTQYFQTEKLIERFSEILDQHGAGNGADTHHAGSAEATYITAILSIMELATRQLVNAREGQITATFARYCEDGTKLDISHRNRRSERSHKTVPAADFILAHRVCQTNPVERIVHDLNAFPRKYQASPTRGRPDYRAFYIIPVKDENANGKVIGFVSIDCNIPYAFHGNRAKFISAAVAPLASKITARLR